MAKFNTESNGYTLGFLALMVLIVGGMLAFVSNFLKPIIEDNQKLDTRTKVMKAILSLPEDKETETLTAKFVNDEYDNNVKGFLVNYNGDVVEESIPLTYNFRKEMKEKPLEDRFFPIYEYVNKGDTITVLQMIGLGLWDEINGYLALKSDMNTIQGVAFDHRGETPGLGAEMVKYKFRKQFFNQELEDAKGTYDFVVYKAGKKPADGKGVDGLSGATLTTNGIDAMIKTTFENYSNFLSKKNK